MWTLRRCSIVHWQGAERHHCRLNSMPPTGGPSRHAEPLRSDVERLHCSRKCAIKKRPRYSLKVEPAVRIVNEATSEYNSQWQRPTDECVFSPRRSSTAASSCRGVSRPVPPAYGVEPICKVMQVMPSGYSRYVVQQGNPTLPCSRVQCGDCRA